MKLKEWIEQVELIHQIQQVELIGCIEIGELMEHKGLV